MYVPILVFAELGFVMKKFGFVFSLVFLTLLVSVAVVESSCNKGCDLAFASYYVWEGATLSGISLYLNASMSDILSYNTHISNPNGLLADSRVNVPFSCDCIDGAFLGHVFSYKIEANDTYTYIAQTTYANLTTVDWIQKFNSYGLNSLPVGGNLNVTVNCSCGNSSVSTEYGLFNTYPLQSGTSMSYLVRLTNLSASLLQSYNPGVDFNARTGLVYLPWRDKSGNYRPLTSGRGSSATSGLSPGVLAGICVAALFGLTIFSVCWYLHRIRRKKRKDSLLSDKPAHQLTQDDVIGKSGGVPVTPGITVDKSVEFPYEELANATDNFSMANKIGQGGFGAVYYGELRGEKAAIKKMDMQATKEFLAELKVLSHVHHLNLVRLIGYCVERSLFLVYEYIENGNLSQHLRGSGDVCPKLLFADHCHGALLLPSTNISYVFPGRAALPWSARVQIALDSARGLEYIHEHTVPVYIHRDIKSANILLDNNFHAKVADFGMTKLAEVGNASIPTGLVGTFGYMPPEYAQFGDASPKVDVYAFGVVLYELISAKEAVVKDESSLHTSSLVTLFEDVRTEPDPSNICKLVDPRLGENYPLDSILKMAELAKACTSEDPELRPSMRSVVVALNALSSTTDIWNIGSFTEHGLLNLVSGR